MASYSSRKTAPAWPPFKDTYRRLTDDDDIPLTGTYKSEIDTAATVSSAFLSNYGTPNKPGFTAPRGSWFNDGWRGGAKIAFCSAILVLVFNVVTLIVMTTALPWMDSMIMVYIGSCEKTEKINTGLHFVVNLFSTALLAASNYCMQLLSAPTRGDIDKAHSKGTWMDIGIPSLRNLRTIRKQKVVLWWLLACSSIPLHLFYNSIFFTAIATNDYAVIYATEQFATGGAYNTTAFPDSNWLNVTDLQAKASTYQRLDNAACINAYAMDFVTDRKDVIAVVRSNSSMAGSTIQKVTKEIIPSGGFNTGFDAFAWICDDKSTPARTNTSPSDQCTYVAPLLQPIADQDWRSAGYDIEYCLSQEIEPDCHVHFAPPLIAPVIIFNIIKAAVITYVAFFYKDKPIVTLGDAIESFSLQPDPTTIGMCLSTNEMIEKHWVKGYTAQPLRYDGERRRWVQAVGWRQWTLFGVLFLLVMAAVVVSIIAGVLDLNPSTIANAWSLGLGNVHAQNLIKGLKAASLGTNGLFITALVANAPQTLFSFVYLIYNNVFTTMALNDEWDRFSIKSGKGRILRVSQPRGDQRSTYFLQLPYRFALVLYAASGMLHWLVSQSVFLANIAVIPLDGTQPMQDEVTTCAYSVKAMFFVLLVCAFMLLWLFGNGYRRLSGGMPFVGSNSAAISAACHSEYGLRCEREAMVLRPLRWGVTDYGNRKSTTKSMMSLEAPFFSHSQPGTGISETFNFKETPKLDQDELFYEQGNESGFQVPVGHCAFTDGRVGKPTHGWLYA